MSKTLTCICKKQGCWTGDPQKGIPAYCQANNYIEELKKSTSEYQKKENIRIYEAACVVGAENNGFRPRIEEALHFTKQLKVSKVGFAACTAFENEIIFLKQFFNDEGIEIACAGCQIGRIDSRERGLPKLNNYINDTCNPIAQAEILNSENTGLNFIVGLCLGPDILFTRYSNAPVSTLIVKDRMMGNNPAGALYGWHARRRLLYKDNYRSHEKGRS